jgi:hypothetical protein
MMQTGVSPIGLTPGDAEFARRALPPQLDIRLLEFCSRIIDQYDAATTFLESVKTS